MVKATRLNSRQAAEHLGLAHSTFQSYRYTKYAPGAQLPTFPPGRDGTWLPSELDRWDKARPGPGPTPGTKREAIHPCENQCGAVVKRRYPTAPEGDPNRLMVCKPCYVAGDPIHGTSTVN